MSQAVQAPRLNGPATRDTALRGAHDSVSIVPVKSGLISAVARQGSPLLPPPVSTTQTVAQRIGILCMLTVLLTLRAPLLPTGLTVKRCPLVRQREALARVTNPMEATPPPVLAVTAP